MAFHDSTGGSHAVYASFADGSLVIRSRDPKDGFTSRTNKIGNTVYEQHHREFTGQLTKIERRENDYGAQWCFTFIDNTEAVPQRYIITDRINGSYAKGIISAVHNKTADLNEPITLCPWRMDDPNNAGKYMVGCVVKQRGQKIARMFCSPNTPMEKRNGATPLPPLKEVKVSGKIVYDDTDQIDVLTYAVEYINARLGVAPAEVAAPAADAAKPANPDDVPF